MDWAYMGKLMLSVAIFAPGLIILAALLFVGLLMGLEKLGALAAFTQGERLDTALPAGQEVAPPAGPIVESLRDAIAQGEAATQDEAGGQQQKTGTFR